MALEWHRRSGKSARDGICRSLARKGLDILDIAGVSVVGGYNHSSRHLIDGVIRNQVEETLGTHKYQEICNQRTVLRMIHYCQSGNPPTHSLKLHQISHTNRILILYNESLETINCRDFATKRNEIFVAK